MRPTGVDDKQIPHSALGFAYFLMQVGQPRSHTSSFKQCMVERRAKVDLYRILRTPASHHWTGIAHPRSRARTAHRRFVEKGLNPWGLDLFWHEDTLHRFLSSSF